MKRDYLNIIICSLFKTVFLLLFSFISFGQQNPLFSNYKFNELVYNPAFTGTKDYTDLRFSYRSQWQNLEGTPQTQVISVHDRIKDIPLGMGFMLHNDKTGPLRRTGGHLFLSYLTDFENNGLLSFGLSGGIPC